jgi:hypothetical protein
LVGFYIAEKNLLGVFKKNGSTVLESPTVLAKNQSASNRANIRNLDSKNIQSNFIECEIAIQVAND